VPDTRGVPQLGQNSAVTAIGWRQEAQGMVAGVMSSADIQRIQSDGTAPRF
jgi:hypothetical protein